MKKNKFSDEKIKNDVKFCIFCEEKKSAIDFEDDVSKKIRKICKDCHKKNKNDKNCDYALSYALKLIDVVLRKTEI